MASATCRPSCSSTSAITNLAPSREAIGETMATKAAADPTVQKAGIFDMARLYLNGADPRSPLAAPICADLTGLAPLLIQVGAAETLLDDAIRLAKVAGGADVRVGLQIWPEMIHIWHLFHPELTARPASDRRRRVVRTRDAFRVRVQLFGRCGARIRSRSELSVRHLSAEACPYATLANNQTPAS